jgi:hypothetical protein
VKKQESELRIQRQFLQVRDTDKVRQIDKQTQTDRQTDRQIDRQADRQTDR